MANKAPLDTCPSAASSMAANQGFFSTFEARMPGYLIPAHANTLRLHKATRDLTRIQHKGLVQKYFISQGAMLFQESILAAGKGMMGTVWVLEQHGGDKA